MQASAWSQVLTQSSGTHPARYCAVDVSNASNAYAGLPTAPPALAGILHARFTQPEVDEAFHHLQLQGLVNPAGVKRPRMLSNTFLAGLQVGLLISCQQIQSSQIVTWM